MIPDLQIKRWLVRFSRARKERVRDLGRALRKHHRVLELEHALSSADTHPGVVR